MLLVTVADDRAQNKNGEYGKTQDRISDFIKKHYKKLGINKMHMWKWDDIKNTEFYNKNSKLLDMVEPDINGRVYKPFVILEGLKTINDGEFLIYNDVSPEHWKILDESTTINTNRFDINILKNFCVQNKGILSLYPYPKSFLNVGLDWRAEGYPEGIISGHTHERMTTPLCLKTMHCEQFKKYKQHASGMMVFQKSIAIQKFVEEWLYYNCMPECCGLCDLELLEKEKGYIPVKDGYKRKPNSNYRYWKEGCTENPLLTGHRHDQSISGLLLNKYGYDKKLLEAKPDSCCFLYYCLKNKHYNIISCIPEL